MPLMSDKTLRRNRRMHRSENAPPPANGQATTTPQFAEATPTPDPSRFTVKHGSDKNAYTILDREKGKLKPRPFRVVEGTEEPVLKLADALGKKGDSIVTQIERAGQVVFHSLGDTGSTRGPESQSQVADKMVADYNDTNPEHVPSFLYHLGVAPISPTRVASCSNDNQLGIAHGGMDGSWANCFFLTSQTPFSPFGALSYLSLGMAKREESVLEQAAVGAAARRHGKTPAQVVLRWGIQRGTAMVTKTSRPERLAENLALFDFELTTGEMAVISALNRNRRFNDPGVFCEAAFHTFCPIYE
jgi:hypothetical protein